MAIFKAVKAGARLGGAIDYITQKEKTEMKLITGIGCNPETAKEDMKETKAYFGKAGGKQFYHYVQSFAPGEITAETAHEIAQKLAAQKFAGQEILIATHQDKNHIHSHFIVNSVSFETGKKFHFNKFDLQATRNLSDEICKSYGLEIIDTKKQSKVFTEASEKKYKVINNAAAGKGNSWLYDIALKVNHARSNAISQAEFISMLEKEKIKTKWIDEKKNIVFSDEKGHKASSNNLSKTFKQEINKEELTNGFKHNELEQERARTATSAAELSKGIENDTSQSISGRIGKPTVERDIDKLKERLQNIDDGTFSKYGGNQKDIERAQDEQRNAESKSKEHNRSASRGIGD